MTPTAVTVDIDESPWNTAFGTRSPFPWERKAAEIEARSDELRRKEEEYRRNSGGVSPQSTDKPLTDAAASSSRNWPACYPLLRHNIATDISDDSPWKPLVYQSLAIWRLFVGALLLNFAAQTGYVIVDIASVFSLIYAAITTLVAPFVSFFTTHYLLYLGAERGRKLYVAVAVAAMSLQLGLWVLMGVGVMDGAAGGVLMLLRLVARRRWVLVGVCGVILAAFTLCLLLSLHLLRRLISVLRSDPTTRHDMRNEAATAIVSNAALRNAAKSLLV